MNMKFWDVLKDNWAVWGLIFLLGYEMAYHIHHGMPL